jgi:hypothetical protein
LLRGNVLRNTATGRTYATLVILHISNICQSIKQVHWEDVERSECRKEVIWALLMYNPLVMRNHDETTRSELLWVASKLE